MAIGGKDTVIKHGTNGATSTLTAFTTKIRGAGVNFEQETADSTTFGDAYREFEATFKNGTFSATYKYDNTVWGQITAIYNGQDTVDFEVSPVGTTSGYPKITFSAFISNFSLDMNVGEILEFPAEWQITGAVTFGSHS